jgi:chromate reductase, NAD(P)H dehydrogenase (quinone)
MIHRVRPSRVLLISGSLRAGSTNTALLRTAQAASPDGVEAVMFEGMAQLPHYNPDDDGEGAPVHPAVATMREAIASAHAVLVSTPEYAGALPGSFKNLLEWTVGDGGLYRKPVGWLNAAGPASPTGAADAYASLRKVLGYVNATVVEEACMNVPVQRSQLGSDGLIGDPNVRTLASKALAMLARAPGADE